MNKKITSGDLEKALGLAEEISADVEDKENHLSVISFLGTVSVLLFVLLFFMGFAHRIRNRFYETGAVYDEIYIILLVISLFILLCYQLRLFLEKQRLVDAIRCDRLMLDDLRRLINGHKEEVGQGMSIVGREVLHMRLKRIKF